MHGQQNINISGTCIVEDFFYKIKTGLRNNLRIEHLTPTALKFVTSIGLSLD